MTDGVDSGLPSNNSQPVTHMLSVFIWATGFHLLLWSPYVIGKTIIFFPCGFYLSSCFFFSLAKSQWSEIGCLPYFHTWCGLSTNLVCMSEMCCMLLAENTGRKDHHFGTIAQLCRAVSLQLRHVSTIGTRRPASADRTVRAANFRRDLERRRTLINGYLESPFPTARLL